MLVVLDTNVLINAIGWKGIERKIFVACISKKLELVESLPLVDELINVLKRPKFEFIPVKEKAEFLKCLVKISKIVYPEIRVDIIKEDKSDNKFIEAAIAAKAPYIITRDKHLLSILTFNNIRIVTPEEFVRIAKIK